MAFVGHLAVTVPANCLCPTSICSSSGGGGEDGRRVHQNHQHPAVTVPRLPRKRRLGVVNSRLNATDLRIVDTPTTSTRSIDSSNKNKDAQVRTVEIPVTCYQIIGVLIQAEKDEIVKAVMDLRNAEIEEGYTMDAVVSRQNLLVDVRDKLLFEPEYAGNIREKVSPKSPIRIPWAWLPAALCLLQEVGEEKLVLEIGRAALQHPDSKPYVHDLLLSMALAECAIATVSFEKNNVSQGFEALARAQCLLRSKISLGKMKLLSQIEESLEELAPVCTLDLLGMPRTPENAERRLGAIAALRELLRQGLDVEAPCQVQDWPFFLSQALHKLMATEIVSLLPWDNLAVTRKNKKSIESQNQRVVIDSNCFYMALAAHLALGFSSKQTDMINKARLISECLTASEGIDLKFEEALCVYLLGQGDESEALERLKQLELTRDSASRKSVSRNEKNASNGKQLLETWLKDNVLGLFSDTRDCSPSLVKFFNGERKTSGNRPIRGATQSLAGINPRKISPAPDSEGKSFDESLAYTNSSRHLGPAAKQLTPNNLQGPLINNDNNISLPSVQLKRNLGSHHGKVWKSWFDREKVAGKLTFVLTLGCILFVTLKLSALQLWRLRSTTGWVPGMSRIYTSSHDWSMYSSLDKSLGPACIRGNNIACKLRKLLSVFTLRVGDRQDALDLQNSHLDSGFPSDVRGVYQRPMSIEEAESLVKQWQITKAEALGPGHEVHGLALVLDGPMLEQWEALAEAAKSKSCFWRFVLLQLSVVRAEISCDKVGREMAEIEALLEEAAELVDESQPKDPNYYSKYKVRYVLRRRDDESWKFCESVIQTP